MYLYSTVYYIVCSFFSRVKSSLSAIFMLVNWPIVYWTLMLNALYYTWLGILKNLKCIVKLKMYNIRIFVIMINILVKRWYDELCDLTCLILINFLQEIL